MALTLLSTATCLRGQASLDFERGTTTHVISLMDDEATRSWMTALYKARLERHLDTAGAVRQASLSVLAQRRKAGLSIHPFYWAAFVAAGDWK